MGIRFRVGQYAEDFVDLQPAQVIFVDGSVAGFKAYDHHLTGERINMDAMPADFPELPEVIATTTIDTDAVCSAVALALGGEAKLPTQTARVFRMASHYCDYLEPHPDYLDVDDAGLGFHCAMKSRLNEEYAIRRLEHSSRDNAARSDVFQVLCADLIRTVETQEPLPNNTDYLNELHAMVDHVPDALEHQDDLVSVLSTKRYLDPLATYRVIHTPLQIIKTPFPDGLWKYSLGVRPSYYGQYDLRQVFPELSKQDPGWGGREIAGGSPWKGTIMTTADVVACLHRVFKAPAKPTQAMQG